MSDFSTPLPSGLRVRDIKTKLVNGVTVADLDAQGREQELSSVAVPLSIEAAGGTLAERQAAIGGFVRDIQTKGPDVALVRADAVIAGEDPAAAETAFVAAQASAAAAEATAESAPNANPAQPGGLN